MFPITDTMVHVQVLDNTCYATLWGSGMIAFDVSDPAITLVGTMPLVDPDSIESMTNMAIQDSLMFTAETKLLRVFSVDDQRDASCDRQADMNNDDDLNYFDVTLFLQYYFAQDPRAELNGDGAFNFYDIILFISSFSRGASE